MLQTKLRESAWASGKAGGKEEEENEEYENEVMKPYEPWLEGDGSMVYNELDKIYGNLNSLSSTSRLPKRTANRFAGKIDDFTVDPCPQDVVVKEYRLKAKGKGSARGREAAEESSIAFWEKKSFFNAEEKKVFLADFKRDASTTYSSIGDDPFRYTCESDEKTFLKSLNVVTDDVYFGKEYPVSVLAKLVDSVEFQSVFCSLSRLKGQGKQFFSVPNDFDKTVFTLGMNRTKTQSQSDQGNKMTLTYDVDPFHQIKLKEIQQRAKEHHLKTVRRAMTRANMQRDQYLPKSQHNTTYVELSNERTRSSAPQTTTKLAPEDTLMFNPNVPNPDGTFPDVTDIDAWDSDEEEAGVDEETKKFAEYVTMKEDPPEEIQRHSNRSRKNLTSDSEVLQFMVERAKRIRTPSSFTIDDQKLREMIYTRLRIVVKLEKEQNEEMGDGDAFVLQSFFMYIKE